MALVLGLWLLRPQRPAPSWHPAETMPVDEARREGLALGGAGRHLASLPYFRRAAQSVDHAWPDLVNYSAALGNAALEGHLHLGKEEPAIRSSVERVAMTRLALAQLVAAEGLAASDDARATVAAERARSLWTWGFPLDAVMEYGRAGSLAPQPQIVRTLQDVSRIVEHGGQEPP